MNAWRSLVCPLLLLLASCGGSSDDGAEVAGSSGAGGSGGGAAGASGAAGGSGAGGTGENRPPELSSSPVMVREGESVDVMVTLSDPDGDTVTVSAEPSEVAKVTVSGQTLHVEALYGEGDAVPLTVSDGRATVSAQLALTVQRLAWGKTWSFASAGLAEREHPSLLVDTARDRVIVHGGSGYKPQGTALDDTWAVSLSTGEATKLTPTGDTLVAAASRRVSPVPGTTTAYLWGGYKTSGNLNDLWLVDFGPEQPVFTIVPQVNAPKARALHLFAYDDVSKTFVVFGGAGATPLADLWTGTLEGGKVTWTQVSPAAEPGKRYGFFYAQDTQRGVIYLFSGATAFNPLNPARDLWLLDLRASPPTFTLIAEGDAVPEGRRNGASAFDEKTQRFIVFGGTPDGKASAPGLWLFDAREGQRRFWRIERPGEPALRSSGVGFVDPRNGAMFVGFGNDKGIYSDFTPLAVPSP